MDIGALGFWWNIKMPNLYLYLLVFYQKSGQGLKGAEQVLGNQPLRLFLWELWDTAAFSLFVKKSITVACLVYASFLISNPRWNPARWQSRGSEWASNLADIFQLICGRVLGSPKEFLCFLLFLFLFRSPRSSGERWASLHGCEGTSPIFTPYSWVVSSLSSNHKVWFWEIPYCLCSCRSKEY